MKVGDIVRQNTIVQFTKRGRDKIPRTLLGVVVEIRNQMSPKKNESEYLRSWIETLGCQVDVLWSNGKVSRNFAEKSLEVVEEKL